MSSSTRKPDGIVNEGLKSATFYKFDEVQVPVQYGKEIDGPKMNSLYFKEVENYNSLSGVKVSGPANEEVLQRVEGNTEEEGRRIREDGEGEKGGRNNEEEGKKIIDGKRLSLSLVLKSLFKDKKKPCETADRLRQHYDFQTAFNIFLPYIVLICFLAYLIAVIVIKSNIQEEHYWCFAEGFLYVWTIIIGLFLVYYHIIKKFFGAYITRSLQPLGTKLSALWHLKLVKYCIFLLLILAVITFYAFDTAGERKRLISFTGLIFIVAFGYVFSFASRKVVWRPVIWGMSIQFLLALFVLRWPMGNKILTCLSTKVVDFLNFSLQGAIFVFGPLADPCGIFAFTVLPVTIFFGFCTNLLYYYGAIQWMVIKLGWLLQVTLGTNLCESMNAAGSIFLSMTEAPLLIKPYLPIMTNSEFHAIMTAGFATVAGSVLMAYMSMGADPVLLITASVMNAPAALALSKLFYPELEKSRINAKTISSLKSTEVNALHAGCVGVTNAIPLVTNIAANLVAFISFIAFFNAVFDWSCQLINIDEGTCTLESVFGYIFMPLAWMMGVQWSDCYDVGQILGLKIIINEFVAFSQLSVFINNKSISERSISLATFAICGFGNLSSIGIMMGGIGPLAPERKNDIARLAFRAMVAGSLATFSSACFAGTLLSYPEEFSVGNATDSTLLTSATTLSQLITSFTEAPSDTPLICNSTIC